MMASEYIVDVNETNFQVEVIEYSIQVPVVVDFWADWCAPCQTLGPILEKFALAAEGEFRLAKVDVDANQSLAMRYNVHGIPAVKAFRNGEIISEFTGAQPEARVQEFIKQLAPHPYDLLIEKGASLLHAQEWQVAEETFRDVLKERTDHPGTMLGLAKSLLAQGQGKEALSLLDDIPSSKEFSTAEKLRPLAIVLSEEKSSEATDDSALTAAYHHATRLITLGNIPAALDGLLGVLREDKNYQDGEAKQLVIALFELLGDDNPQTRTYRAELASILF